MQDSERPPTPEHTPVVFRHQPGYRARRGRNWFFQGLPPQFRQSVFSRLAGYEVTNDAERLAVDPVRACAIAD